MYALNSNRSSGNFVYIASCKRKIPHKIKVTLVYHQKAMFPSLITCTQSIFQIMNIHHWKKSLCTIINAMETAPSHCIPMCSIYTYNKITTLIHLVTNCRVLCLCGIEISYAKFILKLKQLRIALETSDSDV